MAISMKKRSTDVGFNTEIVDVSALQPHPKNYVHHPDDQIEHIMQSISEHGFYRNIIISSDNIILAGHGVVAAAKKMKIEHVPVFRLNFDSNDPRALKVIVGDNEIAHLREIDDRALTEILSDIKDFDLNELLGTGYDEMMLANLLLTTRPDTEIKDLDAAAAWAGVSADEFIQGENSLGVHILFRTVEDRRDFLELIGVNKDAPPDRKTVSLWWPLESNK